MNQHDRRIIHSSGESRWRTPRPCFEALDREFEFLIDAAADTKSALTPCWFGPGRAALFRNGLTADWFASVETLNSDDVLSRRFGDTARWQRACRSGCHGRRAGSRSLFLNPPYSRTLYRASVKVGRPNEALRIERWAEKCWEESRRGCTIVGIFPFAPQTAWYRRWVYGHEACDGQEFAGEPSRMHVSWAGHAAMEERRLPHRISFLRPNGQPADNAGVNSVVIVWRPNPGYVGPWQPAVRYWSYVPGSAAA